VYAPLAPTPELNGDPCQLPGTREKVEPAWAEVLSQPDRYQ
jgi:hypothetical protein